MNVQDLNGNELTWKPTGKVVTTDSRPRSDGHKKVRALLRELFPTVQIQEEVPIPIRPRQTLYLDFYIPLYKIAVEFHGEQHYKFVPHFHGTAYGYAKHRTRDAEKAEWCELNNIILHVLPHDTKEEDWKCQISQPKNS